MADVEAGTNVYVPVREALAYQGLHEQAGMVSSMMDVEDVATAERMSCPGATSKKNSQQAVG